MFLKRCLSILLVMSMALIIVGCGEKVEYTEIKTVLETATNNQDVNVQGVVYGVVNNGYYISDSDEGKIFVSMGSNWTKDVNLGDKVQLTGKFGIFSNMPQIKSVTSTKVESTGNTLPVATQTTVQDLMALDHTAKVGSYAKFVKLTASIGVNLAQNITLADDFGRKILVNSESNTPVLNQKLDTRVSVSVIIHDFNSIENQWRVSFTGTSNDITDTPLTFADLKAIAMADIDAKVAKEVYGKLTLPTVHPTISYLTYTWTASTNDNLTIAQDGTVAISLPEQDVKVNLTAKISANTDNYDYTFEVTVKPIPTTTVKEILETLPAEDDSVVVTKGVVVSIFRNQTSSIRSVMIKDPVSTETITVDFARIGTTTPPNYGSVFDSALIKLGDEIVVTGELRKTGRKTISNVTVISRTRENVEFAHDLEHAYVLKDEASYLAFAQNYEQHMNKLVKVENPYLVYSSSTTPSITNWVRFGYSELSPNTAQGSTNRIFALQIGVTDEMVESLKWRDMFNIPLFNQTPTQFTGAFYAYVTYISDTYITFVVPSKTEWQFYGKESIDYDIKASVPTAINTNTVSLINQHPEITGNITWESSSDVIDVTTGVVKTVFTNTEVTLKAKYTIGEQQYELDIVVTVISGKTMSVSELLKDGVNGQTVKVTGIFGAYHQDGNSNVNNHGILLFDEVTGESILVNGVQNLNASSTYGAYLLSDGTALEFGDKVELITTFEAATSRKYLVVTSTTEFLVVSKANQVVYDLDHAIVIDSKDALATFASSPQYNVIIKFVGTTENPICIGGSSSTMPFNMKVFYTPTATTNDETKFLGKTFALKTNSNVPNAGADWWNTEFGITGAFVGPSTTVAPKLYTGSFYAMLSNETSTYYQLVFVNPEGLNVTKVQ